LFAMPRKAEFIFFRVQMSGVCWSLSIHFAWPLSTLPCVCCAAFLRWCFIAVRYILHLLLLAVVGTFVAHVQVLPVAMWQLYMCRRYPNVLRDCRDAVRRW
jgi:hypothetical protein